MMSPPLLMNNSTIFCFSTKLVLLHVFCHGSLNNVMPIPSPQYNCDTQLEVYHNSV